MSEAFLDTDSYLPEGDARPLNKNSILNEIKRWYKQLVFDGYFPSIPNDLQEMYRYTFPVAAKLLKDLACCKISGSAYGPTGETTLTIKKITAAGVASDIGTLVYAQTTGAVTIAFAADVSFAAGDRLAIYNQADNDASAQGFAWTFVATRL